MVGELDVAFAGQTAKIKFLRDQILLHFADFAKARVFANSPLPALAPIARVLAFSDIGLKAQIGNGKSHELFPRPSWLVRLLSPSVRQLVNASRREAESQL